VTRTETTELSINFDGKDKVKAFNYEFTDQAALTMTDPQGNGISIAFSTEHIPAIEHLLNILYVHRGDYADVVHPHVIERLEAAV
jgi:hypothetical protein